MRTLFLWLSLLYSTTFLAQSGIGFAVDFEVTFETNKSTLSRDQKKQVEHYCKRSVQYFTETIGILGYSDMTGADQSNDTLSLRRAKALRDCIHEFLPLQKIAVHIGDRNDEHISLPQDKQRRAFVIRGLVCGTFDPLEYHGIRVPQVFVIPYFLVPASGKSTRNDREMEVTTYDSAREMIDAGINAVDSLGNVLSVTWIADICIDSEWAAPNGYKVFVPVKHIYENGLKLYVRKNLSQAWHETDIKIETDRTLYNFELEERTGCISFCLGKPARKKQQKSKVIEKAHKVVYISTYKPFGFKNILVSGKYNSLSYSAKLSDTLVAFTLPADISAGEMLFEGYYEEEGTEKKISSPMSKFKYSKNKDGNDHYHITEGAVFPKPKKKKRTFWQWFGDLFR